MNLVVDDAVEVKLKTKDTEESRRELGTSRPIYSHTVRAIALGTFLLLAELKKARAERKIIGVS